MEATAAQNPRIEKGGYHFSISFHADDRPQLDQARMSQTHRELLLYFSSMILDPDGHRRWMADVERREVERRDGDS